MVNSLFKGKVRSDRVDLIVLLGYVYLGTKSTYVLVVVDVRTE